MLDSVLRICRLEIVESWLISMCIFILCCDVVSSLLMISWVLLFLLKM